MNDRRPLLALVLIFVIAFLPMLWLRRNAQEKQAGITAAAVADSTAKAAQAGAPPPPTVSAPGKSAAAPTMTIGAIPATALPLDTVVVRSAIYRYAITNRGAVVSSRFDHYKSLNEAAKGDTIELIPVDASLLGLRLVLGTDTLHLDQIAFKTSADSIDVTKAPATLTMTGTSGGYGVELTWHFFPDDYHFDVTGQVTGLGAVGGTLLIDMGNGFRDTEANIVENRTQSGIVTKQNKTALLRFNALKPQQLTPVSGPFEWVAIKSKYFVAGLFAYDSAAVDGAPGRVAGLIAYAADTNAKPIRAKVTAAIGVPAKGSFGYQVYLGPMEYNRLTAMGHDFDDVNPYGFPGLRTVIRPFAIGIRAAFIWMHQHLGLGYGFVIILFGISVRVLLWPLNQKAMRSMTAMQAIQPEMTALQAKYKDDQARLQQEMMQLYKTNKVNPFGGCWPMLLPYPLLVAVFFVLQNTIELRGVPFLWFEDLSRKDPIFLIPVLMALSMFLLTKIGQKGMPPNPQAKMMMYMMPAVFLFMFSGLASGLNLYYLVQNVASLPQQLMISKERQAMMAARTGGTSSTGNKVEVKKKG